MNSPAVPTADRSTMRGHRGASPPRDGDDGPQTRLSLRLRLLAWAFTLFNSVRVLAYLPTLMAIGESGNADQHSLWTWFTFCGANFTMAAWLYEHNGQRVDRAILVNLANAAMCAAIVAMIVACRWPPR